MAAHARARLAPVLDAAGDTEAAATLYRDVIAWSEDTGGMTRARRSSSRWRGSPATAADAGCGARVADELRARLALT